jgi:uncharacterized protein YndB with AHSA1/START domain
MKSNKLSVVIDKPIEAVFEMSLNPKNTPKWIDAIIKEETDEWPARKGTKYRNSNKNGEWSEYLVAELVDNEIFELRQINGKYRVRYTFRPISENSTELEYFEWLDNSDLEQLFTMDHLLKLKKLIEN